MDIQTEHLENQLVRMTVTIDMARLDDAKQKAARKVASQIRIPGFRKGKVPYHILIKNGLEGEILNQAIESLSQDVYREALQANRHLVPYGPGTFEDFKLEDAPMFIYTVPLQPVAKLGDYRVMRREYTAPEVTDEMVTSALKRIQEEEAEAEDSTAPIELGNRVTFDLHAVFADDPKPRPSQDADAEATMDEQAEDERPVKGAQFAHEHGAQITLDVDEEPILPGFSEKLIGAIVGDELEFELTVPEDDPDYEDVAGRLVKFHVSIEKVEKITLPELNDTFVQKLTEKDPQGQLQTFDEFKAKLYEDIKRQLEREAKNKLIGEVIDALVEQAEISFPDVMLEDQIQDKIETLKGRLRQQGIDFDMYLGIMNMTVEQLQEQYREPAIEELKHMIVLRELLKAERIRATSEDVQAKIDEILIPFGENKQIRELFKKEATRISVLNEILQERLYNRIFDIVTGAELPNLNVEDNAEMSKTGDNPDSEESQSETSG